MGTKVDSKSYLPGHYFMRDLNEDSSSSSWPACYGDKPLQNGQYYNGFMPRTAIDGYTGYGKDALKQKILEHEAVFKNQVYELHRLYRIQRDMMEDFRRKEVYRIRPSMEPSSSSSLRGPQLPSEEARKWHMAGLPLLNSTYEKTSTSAVEIANSPLSCTKGNSMFPLQNGSAKEIELLDSRPVKVRKKLFDLELPADEYIDTEEGQNSPDCKASHVLSYAPNGNLKSGLENQKISPTTDCRIDVSTSASCLRNPIWLADLNDPIDVEEGTAPSSTDFLGHSSINGQTNSVNYHSKSNAGLLGVNAKTAYYRDGFLVNSCVESKVNERGALSRIHEAGSSKNNLDSVTLALQDNSHPLQCMLDPHDQIRRSREDLWREENRHHLESSDRSRDQSNIRFFAPHIASHSPISDPFNSSYFSGTWAHAVPSWAKPSFPRKTTTSDSCLNPAAQMNRGLQISAECRESYGGKWRMGEDPSTGNGFYHGSGSGSKEPKAQLPSPGFDYLNCKTGDTNHGFGHYPKGPFFADSKPAIDINLNDVVSTVVEKGKPADHLSTLPWLKNKPANANGAVDKLPCKTEAVRDLNEPFTKPASSDKVKKILGVPIFDESSSHVTTSKRKNIVIDINLECEPEEEEDVEKEKQAKSGFMRDFIDLNSCVTDCGDALASFSESKAVNAKAILDIDLESPATPEKDDEALRTAAEAIVAISSSRPKTHIDDNDIDLLEATLEESFVWFVNAVKDLSSDMDEFEATTLQIPETKEEDYMPKPFISDAEIGEETPANSVTRPRRGQSRRGRQRRDFQRDILPGLTSLSRHEVTEDIQIFGGLMRATGHQWLSGLARRNGTRNGGGRGRRRAVVGPVCAPLMEQLSNIEAGLEERSLTGWGKTPRRPRRQRCPAGNAAAVVLT